MPSSLTSYTAFRNALDRAISATDRLAHDYPDDRAIASILAQMQQLRIWTENETAPTQDQKDALNFGALASRNLDDLDGTLVQSICEVASYVIYWPDSGETNSTP